MISLLKYLEGPWEQVRGNLITDLEHIENVVNANWGATFGSTNTLQSSTIEGDNSQATRYVSNTGASNGPRWALVNLVNGVSGRLSFDHFPFTQHGTLLGREFGSDGDVEEITLGTNLKMVDAVLTVTSSGTDTNDNASAGDVGEILSAQLLLASATSLSTGTPKNVITLSLTAGDWDVTGVIDYKLTGTTSTKFQSGSSSTSATFGAQDTSVNFPLILTTVTDTFGHIIPTTRFSLASTTTVYLVGQATFSAGTVDAYGTIRARRVR